MKKHRRLASCLLAITLCGAGCGDEQVDGPAVETKKSALTFGSCVVPTDVLNASTSLGHRTLGTNTASATAGDSLLPANNVNLGTFPAGTTVIVGFQGLNQLSSSLTGDTFIRLFDDTGTQVAFGDDACGGLGSRVVYTVPQGTHALTARLGCFSSGTGCAGDLVSWSRLDSNGQLTNVVAAHKAIITGADANGAASLGALGGTSVRNLADLTDFATHNPASTGLVVPVGNGHQIYAEPGNSYNHFEGVQRLRSLPNFVAVTGAFHADLFFAAIGTSGIPVTADQSWLSSRATADGALHFRFSNFDVPALAAEHTNVTEFNHLAGIQTSGRYIAGGASNYPNGTIPCETVEGGFNVGGTCWGRLVLLDASNPANVGTPSTMRKWIIDPEIAAGNTAGIGPSQVGITKLQNGAFLLAMSQSKQQLFHFFMKDIDEGSTVLTPSNVLAGFADIEDGTFASPASPNPRGWTVQDGTGGVTGPDNDAIALVTQTDGTVFLLTSKSTSPVRTMVSPVVLTPKAVSSEPNRAAEKFTVSIAGATAANLGYYCANNSVGCNFNGASGFYINSFDDTLEIYSTSKYMNDAVQPPTMAVSEFTSNKIFGHAVFASSEAPGFPAIGATNGNLKDAAKTNVEANAWQFVDTWTEKPVTGIKIFPCVAAQGCTMPTNFNVFTWNASQWILRSTHTGTMQAGVPESITFTGGPIQTEFVLIQLNGTGSLQVAEYQVF